MFAALGLVLISLTSLSTQAQDWNLRAVKAASAGAAAHRRPGQHPPTLTLSLVSKVSLAIMGTPLVPKKTKPWRPIRAPSTATICPPIKP